MAEINLTLLFETQALVDTISELARVHRLLAKKHGVQFRQLEREIEGLVDDFPLPETHRLEGGGYMLGAPPQVSDILRRARELGVI